MPFITYTLLTLKEIMSSDSNTTDPMEFLKSMWGNMGFSLPGMVTPTLDVDELGKRIADLKAVEGWLKMNLNTLQMTIQGLEMQRVALTTAQAMGQAMSQAAQAAAQNATSTESAQTSAADSAAQLQQTLMNAALNPASALWPWNFMQTATAPECDSATNVPEQSDSPAKPKRSRKKQEE